MNTKLIGSMKGSNYYT